MSDPSMRRQPLVVVRRKSDGLYWAQPRGLGEPTWTKALEQANVINPRKMESLIRIDFGRDPADFEAVPVVPAEIPEC